MFQKNNCGTTLYRVFSGRNIPRYSPAKHANQKRNKIHPGQYSLSSQLGKDWVFYKIVFKGDQQVWVVGSEARGCQSFIMQRHQNHMIIDRTPDADLSLLNRIQERSQALFQQLKANRTRERAMANGDRLTKGQRESQEAENLSPEDMKKQRRKMNKKKKNKRIQMLKQGMSELKGIFEKIYYMNCHYEELMEEIATTMEKIPNKTEFLLRINQLIYEYSEETCQYLWEEESRIIANIQKQQEALRGTLDEEKLKAEQTRRYKIDFTTAIYEEFYVIKTASEDIDKIYDAYYEKDSKDTAYSRTPVYKTTFNYLFDHDSKLKDELYEFLNYFKRQPHRDQQALAKLQEMIQAIDESESEVGRFDNEYSTAGSEDRLKEHTKLCNCKYKEKPTHNAIDEFIWNFKNEELQDQLLLELMELSDFSSRLECSFEDSFVSGIERSLKRK